jgi:glycosyltransferase involved in cell wall biosynthesis
MIINRSPDSSKMLKTNTNIISIIIPVMNCSSTIGTLIDRLLSLQKPLGMDVEIIAGYSPSRDNTLKILKEKGITIAHSTKPGPGPGRNAGVRLSRGEYLYFIDADAYPVNQSLLVDLMKIWRAVGESGCFGGPILLEPGQRWNPIAIADHFACWFFWTRERGSCRSTIPQPTVNMAITRTLFDLLGGFDPKFRVLEDFELQRKMLEQDLPISFCTDIPVYHKARGNITKSWRHSWWWGLPYRDAYLKHDPTRKWLFLNNPRLFQINLPLIFMRRVWLVLRRSWEVSKVMTIYSFPFLMATIFVWSLAVVTNKGQPPPYKETPP